MRRTITLLTVLGLAAAASSMLALRDQFERPAIPEPSAAAPVAPQSSPALQRSVLHRLPARVRPVAPDFVAVPPVELDTLERTAPREPLSPFGRAQVPSEGPPEVRPLFRPIVVMAGTFEAQGYRIQLAGITPTDPAKTCGEAGAVWSCGLHARTAFRKFLRGRAVSCEVPPVPTDEILVRSCKLGARDPAAWLVEHGWAIAQADGPYRESGRKAREAGKGIFSDGPVSASPMPDEAEPVSGVARSGG